MRFLGSLWHAVLGVSVPALRSGSNSGAPILDSGASNTMCCRDKNRRMSVLFQTQAYMINFRCLKRNQRCELTRRLRRVVGPVPGSAHPSTQQRGKLGRLDRASRFTVAP